MMMRVAGIKRMKTLETELQNVSDMADISV